MSGDYTRFTFKPLKDYSGPFKQQGRVDLDSDFNELIEIIDRRWRSESIDIFGHCVVCDVAGTPSQAFQIFPTGVGTFEIGLGRMYVDGIQVENHGRIPLKYLADLGEQEGTLRTPYSDQPYLPAPTPLALTPIASPRTDLIYIDVWQREVTVLEDPSIREIALGGPDTTTRIQSAWQVKALTNVGQHGCGDDIAAWNTLVAPSAGRLTTSALAPPSSDDPCIISPSGGYRGLENRLYRVEIHAPGTIGGGGPAKFKWSRNNASIASTISAMTAANKITVQQVGRDEVLRFDIGNWIEITDDFREFQSQAGHMAQITAIDQANRIITFAPPIPAAVPPILPFNATDPTRHTRVLRWDQTLNVDANGLLDVVAGAIPIEDGVQVQFSLEPADGNFKVGDYWVFSARTADGSVEALTDAPPRGILHHFCRLGFIHWIANGQQSAVDDCRNHWPPACECDTACTVTVGDGIDSHGQFTDIQQAIDALGTLGGIVCIGRGFYRVTAPLLVDATKRNVRIVGTGPATRIVFDPAAGTEKVFLKIRGTEHIGLEKVFVASVNADSLIQITTSRFCRVEDCILVNLPGDRGKNPTGSAIEFQGRCFNCEVTGSALLAARTVMGLESVITKLLIRDNEMVALQVSVLLLEAFGVEIIHNRMRGLPDVRFTDQALTRVNIGEFQLSISTAFRAVPFPITFQAAGVVIFIGAGVVISQNLIVAHVAILGFLFLNARILQNDIVSLVGILLILGAVVKIEDNFILGILVGLINAGIVADLDCTSNEFLGLNGILWMSLTEFLRVFGELLGAAMTSAGLAADGNATVSRLTTAGTNAASDNLGFGAVVVAKIHRNLFLTFQSGINKSQSVISGDVSIVDNTFTFCDSFGINLNSGNKRNELLLRLLRSVINVRHLIQSNSFAVIGPAIVSSTAFTHVEQNSIQCRMVGVDFDAESCTARNNTIVGTSSALAPPDRGLIILHGHAGTAIVSGNTLSDAPGHAILIFEDAIRIRLTKFNFGPAANAAAAVSAAVTGVAIYDNVIQGAHRFGIGGQSQVVSLSNSSIERNRIEGCEGQVPANSVQVGGAVSIGAGANLRFMGNTVRNNIPLTNVGPAGQNQSPNWATVYFEDVTGIELSENLVVDNANLETASEFSAVWLNHMDGVVRFQNNVIRGNGARGLTIGADTKLNAAGVRLPREALVQDNHISSGPTPPLNQFVNVSSFDSLLFQGNRCTVPANTKMILGALFLIATRANVSGNVVDCPPRSGVAVGGTELLVSANSVHAGPIALVVSGSSIIVSSNLTTGIFATPPITIPSLNIPPP